MTIDEGRLLDLMEQGKVHFQDVIETSVLQANIRKEWMKFGAQILVTVTAMAFSLTMTATHPGSEGIYIPIMTGIMGYWLPSPEVPKSSAWKSVDVGTVEKYVDSTFSSPPVPAQPVSAQPVPAQPVPAQPVPETETAGDDVQTPEDAPEHHSRAKATRRAARTAQPETA